MAHRLNELLQTVQVAEPQQVDGLQVFGLRWAGSDRLDYTTLDEGLTAGTLQVTEVSEGGSVPTLKVVNQAGKHVFLMAGEHLIGAKQNRVLNTSLMVAAKGELPVPVSCVEAGRWRYRSQAFASKGTAAHGKLRRLMSKQVGKSYLCAGMPASDQSEVWGEVSRKLGAMGSVSPSSELDQAYEDHGRKLDELLSQVKAPAGCRGVVFAVGGRIAGADLFDKETTLAKLFAKLLRSYALDALETPGGTPVSANDVHRWLTTAAGAQARPFRSPGLGEDVRLEGAGVVGAGLVVEEQPVHVELFPDETPTTAGAAPASA